MFMEKVLLNLRLILRQSVLLHRPQVHTLPVQAPLVQTHPQFQEVHQAHQARVPLLVIVLLFQPRLVNRPQVQLVPVAPRQSVLQNLHLKVRQLVILQVLVHLRVHLWEVHLLLVLHLLLIPQV